MNKKFLWAGIAAAAAVIIAVVLFFALRDTSVVVAVPRVEVDAWRQVLGGIAGRGAPRVKIEGFEGDGQAVLSGRRPGLAAVTVASWTRAAISRGALVPLPAAAFPNPEAITSRLPRSFLIGTGWTDGARLSALPVAFDPWLAFWHRDFLGGQKAAATPPADWAALGGAASRWKKAGAAALALPGRESEALTAWVAILCSAQGPGVPQDVFGGWPVAGRENAAAALGRLAGLERDGTLQGAAFSFVWQDAMDLVSTKKAAGVFLPLSRFRAMNPAASAPLISSRVPAFPGASGTALAAEVRVLVMPTRGARGRGAEIVVAYLSRPDVQRALADGLRMVPCRLDAAVRDGASFEGREAARAATALIPMPGAGADPRGTAAFAEAASAVLRSPGEVSAAIAALYGGR
jgi:hypothetical protein